jgi:hypothetical protein
MSLLILTLLAASLVLWHRSRRIFSTPCRLAAILLGCLTSTLAFAAVFRTHDDGVLAQNQELQSAWRGDLIAEVCRKLPEGKVLLIRYPTFRDPANLLPEGCEEKISLCSNLLGPRLQIYDPVNDVRELAGPNSRVINGTILEDILSRNPGFTAVLIQCPTLPVEMEAITDAGPELSFIDQINDGWREAIAGGRISRFYIDNPSFVSKPGDAVSNAQSFAVRYLCITSELLEQRPELCP